MRIECKTCRHIEKYCTCETFNNNPVSQESQYLCTWQGCQSPGVVSLSTTGGSFYCRKHSKQGIGIDFSIGKGVSPAVALGFPPGSVLVDRALIKTESDVRIVKHLQLLAGKGICTRLAENGGNRNGFEQ